MIEAAPSVKLLARLRQILMVGSVESFAVVVGGVAGLLIVNVLPKDQYAAYTFLIACSTVMIGVTDLGLAHCCLPVVGQRNNEIPWVVGACQHIFRKRWYLLAIGVLIGVPYWYLSSRQHGWHGPGYLLAAGLMMGVVLLTLREHYASTVLMILGRVTTLNRIGFSSNVARIGLLCLALLLPISIWSLPAVLMATLAGSLVAVTLYRRAFRAHSVVETRLAAADARQVDAQVLRIARPLVLPAIFYQVQGVVTVFLVSLFGTSDMMAEVGAFGRLSMALMVIDRVTGILLFPAIARAPGGAPLRRILWQAHTIYLCAMVMALLTAVFLPQYWIMLLGQKYASMQPFVWMVFLAAVLMNGSGFAFRSMTVRGATTGQSYSIFATLALQAGYLAIFGVRDLPSVLGFGIATGVANFGYQYAVLALHWRSWK